MKGLTIQVVARSRLALVLTMAALLAGCGRRDDAGALAHSAVGADGDYLPPPALSGVTLSPGSRLSLTGDATPGLTVRLASPTGQAQSSLADERGQWRIDVAEAGEPRLFGLSMSDRAGKRTVQAQGYLAILPGGQAAQLRAGAGAQVFGAALGGVRILALDYDRQGGAVVAGVAAPGATIGVRVDGVQRGQNTTDAEGRFEVSLSEPLARGEHQIEASDGEHQARTVAPVSPAPTLSGGPYRAERVSLGWRIDWLTPGGGMQSTIIMDRPGGGA
ncbi:hypothetical protein ACO2Q3_09150 [Caulobacter sp. KR2-114]|uniref:hypothetical protein n=1 Tax=Caulobacter sp. KR2-114 TaxID=3400912 RepID=UPI003C04D125